MTSLDVGGHGPGTGACSSTRIERSGKVELDVIVIGAGAAGLAAARKLQQAGKRTLVVEARSRLGGRIFTQWLGDGTAVDLGAAWLHGHSATNPLTDLAKKAQAVLVETNWDDSTDCFEAKGPASGPPDHDEKIMSDATWAQAELVFKSMFQLHLQDQAHRRKVWPQIADEGLWAGVLKLRSKKFGGLEAFDERIRNLVRCLWAEKTEYDYAVELEALSYTWWNWDDSCPGPNMLWQLGYVQLVDYLAQGLDVRLSEPVEQVIDDGESVQVVLKSGERLSCTVCICTLPLGVLRAGRVVFHPALPPDKVLAMSRLGTGLLDKIAIRFDRCFWPESSHALARVPVCDTRRSADALEAPFWVNLKVATGSNTLVAYFVGPTAVRLEGCSDDDLLVHVLDMLRAMFPEAVVDAAVVLEVRVVRWSADEFALGSYTHIPLGSTPADIEEMAKPHGLVHFAGEATHVRYLETVHGAYLSGNRSAQEVLTRMKKARKKRCCDAICQSS